MKRILGPAMLPCLLLMTAAIVRADTLYVSSLGTDEVLRYDPATGAFIDTFIPAAANGGLDAPHAILEREDDVLVASFGTHEVLRYDRESGAFLGALIGPATGAHLVNPVYIAQGPDGRLYISSQGPPGQPVPGADTDQIQRYEQNGDFVDAFVPTASGGLDGPSGFAFGPDDRLYVAGRYSANVIAYDAATGAFDEVLADATDGLGAGNTFGLNFGGNDDFYVASNNAVRRYDLDTGTFIATIPLGFPIGIEPGPDGDVFAATSNNLRSIDADTNAASPPFLGAGGVIDVLNFFHFARDPVPGDCDDDGDVDLDDFGAFQACMSGPTVPLTPGCEHKDFDLDGDIDQSDFGIFQRCISGPGIPSAPNCAD